MVATLTLEHILTFLLDTPMFRDLAADELSQVVHLMQIRRLRRGQVLFEQGQPGDAWYVIYEGEVDVEKDGDCVVSLGPRTCVGEMAVLDGSPRSATIRAACDTTVFRFSRDAFERSLADNNLAAYKLALQMARTLAARQRETTARLATWRNEGASSNADVVLAPILEDATPSE